MDDDLEFIREFLEMIEGEWYPASEELFEEIPQEVFDALNQRLKGALWKCGNCGRVFADAIDSVESSVFDRAVKGCPWCKDSEVQTNVLYLMAFLTKKELSELQAVAHGTATGVVKIVPW